MNHMSTGRRDRLRSTTSDLSSVEELLARVAAERAIDFEPVPVSMVDALPTLLSLVAALVERLEDPQERRWLAAALAAALSHHVQACSVESTAAPVALVARLCGVSQA